MATYTPADTQALREIIKSSGVPHLENSISYIFGCPRCGKAQKLYIRKTDGRFVCWVCKDVSGFQGRPEFALSELLLQPVAELRLRLYGEKAPQAAAYLESHLRDFFGDEDDQDADADELQIVAWPPDFYDIDNRFCDRARQYLEKRGVSLEIAREYGLRYCPPQQRLIFPVQSGGFLYGWQGRHVGSTEWQHPDTGEVLSVPKVTTLKGFKKERTLMFGDRLNGSQHAVLCEGPIDALKAHLCGGNVATMGKLVSRTQVALLRNSGIRKLYIGLDPDAALEILKLTREFSDLEVYDLRAPAPFKDLGEMSPGDVLSLFRDARRVNAGMLFHYVERDPVVIDRRRIQARDRKDNYLRFRRGAK